MRFSMGPGDLVFNRNFRTRTRIVLKTSRSFLTPKNHVRKYQLHMKVHTNDLSTKARFCVFFLLVPKIRDRSQHYYTYLNSFAA
jgi:hypothetical protein